jgi:hypothetical protein
MRRPHRPSLSADSLQRLPQTTIRWLGLPPRRGPAAAVARATYICREGLGNARWGAPGSALGDARDMSGARGFEYRENKLEMERKGTK